MATDTRRRLLEICSRILNAERIGIDDDFLALGGDSLAATRCIHHIGADSAWTCRSSSCCSTPRRSPA